MLRVHGCCCLGQPLFSPQLAAATMSVTEGLLQSHLAMQVRWAGYLYSWEGQAEAVRMWKKSKRLSTGMWRQLRAGCGKWLVNVKRP